MYSTPQIENVGKASELIQGNIGTGGEPGVSGHTKPTMLTELEVD
ncbi:MAG TPA: hypothetical protein VN911_02700 [Candidatus Acidoferrum sp.]|jgi:hypothetical protein|nr:hypothetical protein [Candidatus Acidoferrum sp.]